MHLGRGEMQKKTLLMAGSELEVVYWRNGSRTTGVRHAIRQELRKACLADWNNAQEAQSGLAGIELYPDATVHVTAGTKASLLHIVLLEEIEHWAHGVRSGEVSRGLDQA